MITAIRVKGVRKVDIDAWKASPLTQAFLKTVEDELDIVRDNLGSGNYLNYDSPYRTQAATADAVGVCKAFEAILNVQADDEEK